MRALLVVSVVLLGCDPSVMIGEPVDAGSRVDAGVVDAGVDAGVADAGGVMITGGCPRVRLGRSTQVTFSADTSALPNLVISQRLEWGDAPDDALEFIAAETGDYEITFTSSNVSLNASAQEYQPSGPMKPWTSAACPAAGLVVSIDGVYSANQPGYPVALTAGQSMVIFVSAPTWAAVKTGTYTVVVKKL